MIHVTDETADYGIFSVSRIELNETKRQSRSQQFFSCTSFRGGASTASILGTEKGVRRFGFFFKFFTIWRGITTRGILWKKTKKNYWFS